MSNAAPKIAEQALDLVALALSAEAQSNGVNLSYPRAAALTMLKAAIKSRLHDPNLKPVSAAAAAGISVRYANALMHRSGPGSRATSLAGGSSAAAARSTTPRSAPHHRRHRLLLGVLRSLPLRTALQGRVRVSRRRIPQATQRMTLGKVRFAACVLPTLILPLPALAKVQPFPAGFRTQEIETDGATIHVRVGGNGPAVVLLHGFGDTGDMWAPLATELVPGPHGDRAGPARDGALVASRRRLRQEDQAGDIARVLDTLNVDRGRPRHARHRQHGRLCLRGAVSRPRHALGRRWTRRCPASVRGTNILQIPLLWHFNFRGPDVERLVAGRERIYLDRFYNEFSANPKAIDEATREHYAALYARPDAMHYAFEQFAAFRQDAIDNKAFVATGKLTMPVLAIGAREVVRHGHGRRSPLRRDQRARRR